jgi:hypothetical protein
MIRRTPITAQRLWQRQGFALIFLWKGAELMEALENLPEGNPLKDKPAYQAVAKRRYVRVPRIISI